ncbi:MAG TPA: hypothetical protein IAC41_11760 [Candidatus Merdenecus merdavium]|nr:hypothetical protein [Candidatus Merdenecus merdavium]
MYKLLVGDGTRLDQKGFFWNMVSSLFHSMVFYILLAIANRIVGVSNPLGYANNFSVWMVTVGNFGMRNYQSTDIQNKFSFGSYLGSRITTCMIMIALSISIIGFRFARQEYTLEFALVAFFLCILRVGDAMEDVYDAMYQKHHRLDIGGRMWTFRVILYAIAFIVTLILTKNMIIATVVTALVSTVALLWFIPLVRNLFEEDRPDFSMEPILQLFKECLPLFLGGFLLVYISMAPREGISKLMDETAQGVYSALSMPSFVINLMIGLVTRPILVNISVYWSKNDKRDFLKLCGKLIGLTLLLTFVVVIGGYFIGAPVLGYLVGVDLMPHRDSFAVLLIGGGAIALSGVLQVILTTMRRQYMALFGIAVGAVVAFFLKIPLVKAYGIMGASFTYLIGSLAMCLVFIFTAVWAFLKSKKEN